MAKHRAWHGADIKRARRKKLKAEKKKKAEIEEEETQIAKQFGVFGATLITFFLAEMGDKTQVATVAMAAHFSNALFVVAGTTLGMLIADIPAVFIGNKFASKIPMKLVHSVAAAIFAILGLLTLFKVEEYF